MENQREGDLMKCKDCEHFHVRQEPLRTPGKLWDLGLAECQKYNLVVDFADHSKLDKLECYRERQPDERCENCKYFCRLKHNFQVGRGFEDAYACFVMMHGKGWMQEVKPNEMCEMFVKKEGE